MINNTEEPIEDIEYFDKSKNFEIQLYRKIKVHLGLIRITKC